MLGDQVICWGIRSYVGVRSYVGGSGHMFWVRSYVGGPCFMLGGQVIC